MESSQLDTFEAEKLKEGCSSLNRSLLPTLMDVSDTANSSMRELFHHPDTYKKLYANIVLSLMRERIQEFPIEGFKLDAHADRLWLVNQQYGFQVRFNKAFAFTGKLHPAGLTESSKSAYLQGRLRTEEELQQAGLFAGNDLLADDILFVSWQQLANGSINIVAAKPVDVGHFPHSPEVSLSFPLGVDEEIFRKKFNPVQTGEPLFVRPQNVVETSLLTENSIENVSLSKE
ncbi:hypothetical protein [Bifidobacterium crudilactis]|uniref:hypothetical protein n=1 Tax=Bifidobacterium crudilactis TaxID=327277 RepID=UPI0023522B98|nr:hypothetical protein [Bifidobacterium crudilactis]MCI1868239.1 hypothetical protein [Bifidobacterium crudilactis]